MKIHLLGRKHQGVGKSKGHPGQSHEQQRQWEERRKWEKEEGSRNSWSWRSQAARQADIPGTWPVMCSVQKPTWLPAACEPETVQCTHPQTQGRVLGTTKLEDTAQCVLDSNSLQGWFTHPRPKPGPNPTRVEVSEARL
jgi:hypothetical protein